jgi:2-(1,2-epoxy-1,2-dihydrophenyl)acetyl-CoA isomerase
MVMADNAYMLMAFTNIALVPDGGVSWLLLQKMGYNRAFELIVEGGKLSAHACVSAGIANKLVPADQVLDRAQRWAEELAARAPLAIGEAKLLLRQAASHSYSETVVQEAAAQNRCVVTADAQEAVKAFMEKRPPIFVGA